MVSPAKGSSSYRRIVGPPPDGELDPPVELVPADNHSDCVGKLADGRLDAVSTENLHKWFGRTGLELPASLPRPEGCP
ncbi:hypothetical protein [Nonomuraea sp. NPDC049480]|uniref:hypothetical protein n=1 Tax=Nonomuraea sp. NPDC049480 TaxID=3364353 RepID=UPI0037B704B4